MKLFAKEVILAATVPVLLLIFANPMSFDRQQQIYAALAVLFIGLFVAHTLEKSGNSSPTSPVPPTTPQATVILKQGSIPSHERVFTKTTVKELRSLYSKGRTSLEGDKLIGPYKGTWIEVTGTLSNISPTIGGIGVSIRTDSSSTKMPTEMPDLIAIFPKQSELTLERISPGEKIKVRGEISGFTGKTLFLDSAEVIDAK